MNDRKIGTKRVNRTKGKATAVAQADVSQRTDADEASATLRRIWHHYRQATQGFWQRAADPESGTLEERRALLAEIRRAVLGNAEAARMHGTRLATKVRDIIALSEAQSRDPDDPDSDVACRLSTPYLVLHQMVLTAVQRTREEDPSEWIGESEVFEHGLLVLIAADRDFDPATVGFSECPPWRARAIPAVAIMHNRVALLGGDPGWPGFWRLARYIRDLLAEFAVSGNPSRTSFISPVSLNAPTSLVNGETIKATAITTLCRQKRWNRATLIRKGNIGETTFDRIREDAGLPAGIKGKKGRWYYADDVRAMLAVVDSSAPERAEEVRVAWGALLAE